MNVKEFRILRNGLESSISSEASRLVEEFREKTGFSPKSIMVQMINVSEIGNPEPVFIVGKTHIDIEI